MLPAIPPRAAVRLASAAVAGALAASAADAQTPACAPRAAAPTSAALFAYNAADPLDLRDSVVRVVHGVAVHRVSFASPKGGRATGVLYVPPDSVRARTGQPAGRSAGVVVLHGAPGDAAGMAFVDEPLARAGAVVLTIDAPFARRDPQKPLAFTPQDSADVVQYVVDLRRAVDVLAARPDVDARRIAAAGISYGGAMGALLVAVEPRLRTAVLSVADDGIAAHYTAADGSRWAPPPGTAAADWCRWYDAMEPLAASRFFRRGATPPTLYLWGTQDPLVKPYLARALWRAAPAPKAARWYASGHGLPTAAGDDVHAWLARHVGTAPPPAFAGRLAELAGTYRGWGGMGEPLELTVVVDTGGRLAMPGPFARPDDPAARLSYLGGGPERPRFRLDDKQLTFVRSGGRTTELHVDAPLGAPADAPRFHLALPRVSTGAPPRQQRDRP